MTKKNERSFNFFPNYIPQDPFDAYKHSHHIVSNFSIRDKNENWIPFCWNKPKILVKRKGSTTCIHWSSHTIERSLFYSLFPKYVFKRALKLVWNTQMNNVHKGWSKKILIENPSSLLDFFGTTFTLKSTECKKHNIKIYGWKKATLDTLGQASCIINMFGIWPNLKHDLGKQNACISKKVFFWGGKIKLRILCFTQYFPPPKKKLNSTRPRSNCWEVVDAAVITHFPPFGPPETLWHLEGDGKNPSQKIRPNFKVGGVCF